MSAPIQDNPPLTGLLDKLFVVFVPIVIIAMLGFLGAAFIKGSGPLPEKPELVAEAAAPAAKEAPAEKDDAETAAEPTEEKAATAEPVVAAAAPAGEIDPAQMKLGRTAWATCAACHGMDGQGIKAGPALMAPGLTGSPLLVGDPDEALLILFKGIAKENMDYMGMMAALGAGLDDEKMAAVLTYARNSFGNSAPAITVEQAAAAREKFAAVDAPAGVKRDEIPSIVAEYK